MAAAICVPVLYVWFLTVHVITCNRSLADQWTSDACPPSGDLYDGILGHGGLYESVSFTFSLSGPSGNASLVVLDQ